LFISQMLSQPNTDRKSQQNAQVEKFLQSVADLLLDVLEGDAAALHGEAGQAVHSHHHGGVGIRREGGVGDEAAALALGLHADLRHLQAAGAAGKSDLAEESLSNADDNWHGLNTLSAAKLLLDAQAFVDASAAGVGHAVTPQELVAARAASEDGKVGGIELGDSRGHCYCVREYMVFECSSEGGAKDGAWCALSIITRCIVI
jgi:hypothetical protein